MATSVTSIANRAAQKLGTARLVNVATDNVKFSNAVNSCFEELRDEELSNKPWSFAMTRTTIPADDDPPDWGYGSAYTIPTNCLRIVQINDFQSALSLVNYRSYVDSLYALEGGKILTDLPGPLKIRYVQRITDVSRFDNGFVEVLACRIAFETCEEMLQSPTKKQALAQEYRAALASAAQSNAIEKAPEAPIDGSWLLARL